MLDVFKMIVENPILGLVAIILYVLVVIGIATGGEGGLD
jgi:hypothetical protein